MFPSLKSISIRVKLAVLASAVVVLVVLGQTFQSLVGESVIVQEELSLRARLLIMSVGSAVTPLWTDAHTPDLAPFAERIGRELDVTSLALLDNDGRVLTHHGAVPREEDIVRVSHMRLRATPRSLWSLASAPLDLVAIAPLVEGERPRGYLFCAFTSEEPSRRLAGLVRDSIWTALFWVAVGGGLTLWVTRRLTSPLIELADDLASADADGYRLPPDGVAHGEIGVVQERLGEYSERLRAEQARVRELNEALRHQVNVVTRDLEHLAAQRQVVLDSIRDGVLLLTAEGEVVTCNGRARELLGPCLENLEAPVWTLLSDGEGLHNALRSARSLRQPTMVHGRTRREDDGGRDLRITVAPTVAAEGEPPGVVVVLEDVTESRRLEEQMMRSERLASIGTLTAGLAHQVGNHLHAIRGYSELLAKQAPADPRLKEDVEMIRREVREAASLMDRVLLLARTRPVAPLPMHLPTVVGEAANLVAAHGRSVGVGLAVSLPEGGCNAWGDPQLLTQALLNLLMNAVQASPRGSTVHVSTSCGCAGSCSIHIADEGPGVPEELRSVIFDPFFTTKPVGEGTGLGLPIAHRIVQLHGGEIRVHAGPEGRGAHFEVQLPIAEGQAPRKGVDAVAAVGGALGSEQRRL